MADKDVWMRPTEALLAPFIWLAELEGVQNVDRRSLAEQSFAYILSLPEEIEQDGESELSRKLKLAAKTRVPTNIVVEKLPSSLNIRINEELKDKVKDKFLRVFIGTKNIQMPYMFRVSAIAYALYLLEENRAIGKRHYREIPYNSIEVKNSLDIMQISYRISEMMIRNMPKDMEYINRIIEIMEERESKDYFEVYPGTPPLYEDGDYRCSVHFCNTYRLDKAKEQITYAPVSIGDIIQYVNMFLKSIRMTISEYEPKTCTTDIDYAYIKEQCKLADERDIVWMKFTKDGYLGVVATSNDINFDIPINSEDYDQKVKVYNEYYKKYQYMWKYNTSGILVHQLGKEWDESYVLIFPLVNIPHGYTRGDIERAIGNMLIAKGVPVIDFYSHNY